MTDTNEVLVKAEFDSRAVDLYTFQFFAMKKTWPTRLLYWMINFIEFGFFPFAILATVLYGDLSQEWSILLLMVLNPVGYLLYLGYYRFVRFRKDYDPKKNKAIPHETFYFYTDHFVNNTDSSLEKSEEIHQYSGCTNAYETKKYFYIFIAKNSGYVIRKSAITIGTVDDLRAILKRSFGRRFYKR